MAEKLTRKEKFAKQKGTVSVKQLEKDEISRRSVARILGLIIAIAGFLFYSNTLNHDYVLDDFGLIRDNTQTKQGIAAVPEIFKSSYRFGMNITDYQLYRPLTKAMFAVEWEIKPETPALGHWVNVIFFSLLCCIIFGTLYSYMNGNLLVPFITALLFAVHPLHTEVVANIKGRDEIVCLLFSLLSAWSFHKYVTKNSLLALFGGGALYFIALLAKESAITFLAVVPLLYYFFSSAKSDKYYKTLSIMAVFTVIFLLIRRKVLGDVDSPIPVEDNSLAGINNILVQRANAIYILGVYMYKLVFPIPLVSDGSYNSFPPIPLTSWKFIIPFLVLVASGVYGLMRFKIKDPVSFGILFFFVTVSLVSNVVILIGTNYGERLMFMPSLGFCFIVAVLISRLMKSEQAGKIYTSLNSFLAQNTRPLLLTMVITILFAIKTFARNVTWKDNMSLYTTDVKQVPNSAHMLFYLANHITNEDYIDLIPDSIGKRKLRLEALDYLTRAVTIYPKYADGFQRRGLIFNQLGDKVKAEEDYKMALKYNHTHPIVYNNYGTLCFDQRRYDEAMSHFKNAVRYNPKYAHALNNVASVYGVYGLGEQEQITRDPANAAAHAARSKENFEYAVSYFLMSIEADKEFAEPYRLVAVTYRNLGRIAEAERYERLHKQVTETSRAKN